MNKSTLVPREEMSDLDWLARNVHVWPFNIFDSKPTEKYMWHQPYCGGDILAVFRDRSSVFTKDQWLARRAELQNKPSWVDAPEWAEWLAQDEDGEWKWLAGLPGKYVDGWTAVKIKGHCKGIALGDWWDTLEKRPEQKAFEPFTSIEDNQEKDMKQDNGWFERGELPPVGTACEAFGKFPTAPCEIIAYSPEQVAIRWLDNGLLDVIDLKTGDIPSIDFRPILTERDELVNVFINHYGNPKGAEGYIGIADAILAAGFKRDGGEK